MEESKKIVDILRQDVNSVSLKDIIGAEERELKLTEAQLKERAADIELFWKKWGADMYLVAFWEQLKKVAHTAGDPILFKQGVVEGIVLMMKKFEQEAGVSLARFDKPEEEPNLEEIP